MSRKRRSFLGRDDVMDVPENTIEKNLPEPYQPPEPKTPPQEDPLEQTDLDFDLGLPESMDEQIPGFFEWDGGDGYEEPPTEEVPTPPMDAWTDDFSAPLGVPEAPLMEGIIDGATPAPVGPTRSTEMPDPILPEEEKYDEFESLFDIPEPSKIPKEVGGLSLTRLIFFLVIAIVLGLGLSVPIAMVMLWDGLNQEPLPPPPKSIPIQKELGSRSTMDVDTPPPSAAATTLRSVRETKSAPKAEKKKPASKMSTLRVRVQNTVDQVDIWIDGEFFGSAPINVALEPGTHRISAVPAGAEQLKKEREIEMVSGQVETVDFEF